MLLFSVENVISPLYLILLEIFWFFCFVDIQIFICDFHREQAWERWLAKSTNGLTENKQIIFAKLRAIARSRTEQEYSEKVSELKDSRVWQSSTSFQNYISKTWLPQQKVPLKQLGMFGFD